MTTTVVVLEGEAPVQHVPSGLDPGDVIAVDAGLAAAQRWGLTADRVVGDLDSVPPEVLDRAVAAGVRVERHPAAKDETDFELAARAVPPDATRVVVLGGDGGRLDHLLGNLAVLAALGGSGLDVEAWLGTTLVVPVGGRGWSRELAAGTLISLQAWGGPAVVSLSGVRWPLRHEAVSPTSTRCLSNEAVGGSVRLEVHEGVALCVLPGSAEVAS